MTMPMTLIILLFLFTAGTKALPVLHTRRNNRVCYSSLRIGQDDKRILGGSSFSSKREILSSTSLLLPGSQLWHLSGGSLGESPIDIVNRRKQQLNLLKKKNDKGVIVVDALVVGAGLTGCSHAFHLVHNHNVDSVLLCEKSKEVGGNCKSRSGNGFIWEEGPNSLRLTPEYIKTIVDLNITDEVVLAKNTLNRYILFRKQVRALPTSLRQALSFSLLSPLGTLRAFLGFFGIMISAKPSDREESIKDFFCRNLGREVYARMVDAFVSGVFAGDPEKLSMSAAFPKPYQLDGAGLFRGLFFGQLAISRQEKKLNRLLISQKEMKEMDKPANLKSLSVDATPVINNSTFISSNRSDTGSTVKKGGKMFLNFLQDGNTPLSSDTIDGTSEETAISTATSTATATPDSAQKHVSSSSGPHALSHVKVNSVGSFKRGMQTLPLAVAQVLGPRRVRTEWELIGVEEEGEGNNKRFIAKFNTPNGVKTVKAKSMLVSTPARSTSKLISNIVPAAKLLNKVPSPPVASLVLAYPTACVRRLKGGTDIDPLHGFGCLMPRSERIRSLGFIFCSSLFPERAPEGFVLLTVFIGGSHDYDVTHLSEEELFQIADGDIHKVLLYENAPQGHRLSFKLWSEAIPQYCIGHNDIIQAVSIDESKVKGLFLGGNYRGGVALGDCVANGMRSATKMAQYLKTCKL